MTEIDSKADQRTEVDRDLITMFLRMSPEERIQTNDNSIRAILDLRDAFKKENPLDILAFIEKGRGYKELLTDAVEIELYGYKVYVLSLQTLIELKRDSKDPMDRYRLPIFEETLRQSRENNKK